MNRLIIPPVFVLIALVLIVLFYFLFPTYNMIPFPFNLAGILVAFAGITIMGKSRDLFRKYQTTRDFKRSSYLITEGVFARTRNPMYLGMFLLLSGIVICFGNLVSILSTIFFIVAIHFIFVKKEEKMMQETFGEQYAAYKNKVKRWL
jgi:protein-S-isoprenylcysteine O-methyltransferase Ste14